MIQVCHAWQRCYALQILSKVQKFLISVSVSVGMLVGKDDQAILGIHDIVSPQVIKHDGVGFSVVVWKLGPDEAQWLAVKHTCTTLGLLGQLKHSRHIRGASLAPPAIQAASAETAFLHTYHISQYELSS